MARELLDYNREKQMVALTRNEIFDELMKLGIVTQSELRALLREYLRYYADDYPEITSSHE